MIWLLYFSHKWMLERRLDIFQRILTKTQKSLDVMPFITTFKLRNTLHFKTRTIIINRYTTSWNLPQAEKQIIHKIFQIFQILSSTQQKLTVRPPMTFLLTPKITATLMIITISETPGSCFTSGPSLKEDTNINTVTNVSIIFVDLLFTVQNALTLRETQTSH